MKASLGWRSRVGGGLVAATVAVTAGAGAESVRQPAPAARVAIPFPRDEGSLTPYTFELGYPLVSLVYDTLLLRDAAGVPQPWVARSVDTSADGRSLTIRLHPGARWHDGLPLTSADVAFTFDFVARHPHPRFTPELRAVEAVATPDPATVVVTLRHPSPGFVDQPLADLPVLPAHLWRDLPPGRAAPEGLPVGSGPYRLVEHRPGQRYRFEADPGYFRGRPAVAVIDVPLIDDVDGVVAAFEQRRLDMVPAGLPPAVADRLERLGTIVRRGTSYVGTVLMFNLRRPPFDRPEVRRAVAQAVDLERVVAGVGDGVAAGRGYLHPASPWSSATVLHRFDLAAARARLAAAGLPPVEILAPDIDPVRAEAGRQVAAALGRAGVQAVARVVPRAALSTAVGEDGSLPSFQAAIWGAAPLASYDPDFLRRVFGSDRRDASLNYAGYASPAFDALAERIATTTDPGARRAAVGEALRLLAADVPVVPLFFSGGAYAYRPATYDRWVFVKGSGILDKRSFVTPAPPPAAAPGVAAEPAATGRWWRPGFFALVLLGLAAALAASGLVRRRR